MLSSWYHLFNLNNLNLPLTFLFCFSTSSCSSLLQTFHFKNWLLTISAKIASSNCPLNTLPQPSHSKASTSNTPTTSTLPDLEPLPTSTTPKVLFQYTIDLQNPFESFYLLNNSILQLQHHVCVSKDNRYLSFSLST